MLLLATTTVEISKLFLELGAAIVGLAVLARIASWMGLSPIPLYLLGGLAFGNGGLLPLGLSENFIHTGAEIGVLLLLFMVGLEYSGEDLRRNLGVALPAGIADAVLNFLPGFVAALILGWHLVAAVLMGGVTWVSSSAIVAKLLSESKPTPPEASSVMSLLVLEDLAMAVYLPVAAALVVGGGLAETSISVLIALLAVGLVLLLALRFGRRVSRWLLHESDEVVLLTTVGVVVLAAGFAERLHVSPAIGAFLIGVAFSGPLAKQAHQLIAPLRDFFAATFFFFFGLAIDPSSLLPVWKIASLLAVATAAAKVLTGYFAARRSGHGPRGCWRAGFSLIPRGEFSIVIASLGSAIEPRLGAVSAAYVLLLAVLGPVAARLLK